MSKTVYDMLKLIDERIAALTQIRKKIVEEFGEKKTIKEKTTRNKPSKRKGHVIGLIQTYGPLRRAQIIKETGFPAGTIAYVLNDKSIFYNMDGKWHLQNKYGEKVVESD